MIWLDKLVKIMVYYLASVFALAGVILLIPGAIGLGLITIALKLTQLVEDL